MAKLKKCSKCNIEKPIEEFYFNKSKNKHEASCKKCVRKKVKEWELRKPKTPRCCKACGISLNNKHKVFCSNDCRICFSKNENHPMYGKHHSKNSKEKISKNSARIWAGKKRPEETGRKISKALSGKLLTHEHKKNLSISHKGKHFSEEHKKNIGKGNIGRKVSEETRLKISKANTGRKHTEEGIRNIKIGITGYYAIKKKHRPNYNLKSIEYFKEFDKNNNTTGIFATNPKEFYIKELGYYLDYINFDMKLIIEWDEERHYVRKALREKDIKRQKEIENLFSSFKFERIREKNING